MPTTPQIDEVLLSNKIPVVFQNYDGPVAAIYWWIRAGSCDEKPREAGFAHFLEHMLFKDAAAKDTGRPSSGQMARAIESLGGDINAYTSFDQTVYHVTCAEHHWEKIMSVFGAMAKPQRFLKDDFNREREVILEELRKNQDSPGRQLFETLFNSTFATHPYGKPVIGYEKILKAAKVTELEAFYNRNYVSDNMGLILVGPYGQANSARQKKLIQLAEKYFGSKVHRKKAGVRILRPVEKELRAGPVIKTKTFDVKTPSLSYSFRVPELSHPDTAVIDLMAGVLGAGEVSRLYQSLFYKNALATEVSGGVYVPRDPGMLYFQAEVDALSKVQPLTEKMFDEFVRIREEGPTKEELDRIITNVESEKLYATQTADGLAGRLGFLRFMVNDLDFDRKYIDELRAADGSRMRAVAEKYFDPRRMGGVVLVPKDAGKFDVKPLVELAQKKLKVTALPAVKKFNKKPGLGLTVETFTTSRGLQVLFHERPQSHVVGVYAAVLGGARFDLSAEAHGGPSHWGLSNLLGQVWTKGTTQKSALQIAQLVEGKAAALDGFSGRNSIGMQMTGLSRDWKELSSLFNEALVQPAFPDDEIEHAKRVTEEEIKNIADHSSRLCSKLFLENLFETHPYGKMTMGSEESLRGLTRQQLLKTHQALVQPERMVLSISGSIKRLELEKWVEELERSFVERGQTGKGDLRLSLPDEAALKAPRWIYKNLGREQVHILVGGLGIRFDDQDRYALRILQNILGGQSGRLFIELREKKSMAYSVAPVAMEGMERGYVGTYIACAPAKKDEAIAGIRTVLEVLAQKGPSAEELVRAKEYYLGQRAMELQSDSALAAHFALQALYQLPLNSDQELIKQIRGVTAQQIKAVCKKYFVDPYMVTSVVG